MKIITSHPWICTMNFPKFIVSNQKEESTSIQRVKLVLAWLYLVVWHQNKGAWPCSTFGNMSDCIYVSGCRSRGRKFDPGLVPYFRGDWSWNNFYNHSPPFHWFKKSCLSVTSKSMCTKYRFFGWAPCISSNIPLVLLWDAYKGFLGPSNLLKGLSKFQMDPYNCKRIIDSLGLIRLFFWFP